MTVQVTQDCIDKGRRHDSHGCPVALALQTLTGEDISVGATLAFVGIHAMCSLPQIATRFIVDFDFGCSGARPFEFEAEVYMREEVAR